MPEQKQKKLGRPPLPDKERRRAAMGFRPTPEIRERLEKAAEENKRSLSQEIESRLETSFLKEDAKHEVFGGREQFEIFKLLAGAAGIIEARKGRSWLEDWLTFISVRKAWDSLISSAAPRPPEELSTAYEKIRTVGVPAFPLPPSLGGDEKEWREGQDQFAEWSRASEDAARPANEWRQRIGEAEKAGQDVAMGLFPERRKD